MKKNLLVVICFVLLFCVVGCGKKNQVICTKTTTDGDKSMTEEGVFELDDNNKIVKASGTFTFNDEEIANSYCELFKAGLNPEYLNILSCNGNKITISDLDKMIDDEEESTKLIGMSKNNLIELETEEGYSCK